MNNEIVKHIQDLTKSLGEIIVGLEPENPAAWDAMEKMQAAHKQLRSIDIAELIEQPPRAPMTE